MRTATLDRDLVAELIAEARLAPSVHNIQPTRWRYDGDAILAFGAPRARLPVADPKGHDVRLSHGAAIEGLSLALGRRGFRIARLDTAVAAEPHGVARLVLSSGAKADPLAEAVFRRASWRGRFTPRSADLSQRLSLMADAVDNLVIVSDPPVVSQIAELADRAAFHFLCDDDHRRELLHWMRFDRRHAGYGRDGLDAEALALGPLEAIAAPLVLGPLFPLLHRLGLAGILTSERAKLASGAFALFHRPADEDPLNSGRAFYRAWLAMERAGLAGCPISVLADWPESHGALVRQCHLPPGRRLVNVFRIGIPDARTAVRHARLDVRELIS